MLVKQALVLMVLVSNVNPVNTVRTQMQMEPRPTQVLVWNAQRDSIKMTKDKRPASNAAPVNSMTLWVPLNANYAQSRRTLVKRAETVLASIVQQVGRPETAVLNVLRVMRVRLALGVQSVHWVFSEKETTMMRPNANNVNWVKQQRLKVRRLVILVTLVNLAVATVFVLPAPLVFIKTTKRKQNAWNANLENLTSVPKQHAVSATLVRLAAGKVIAKHARLDFIKIPKVKRSAVTFVPRLEKYPTTNAPDVNYHRGVPAKWVNI